jgi:hypothetical protein
MAQTLDATLAAAQLLTERHPLVEILSDKFVPDIPFVGQRLATDYEITPVGEYDTPLDERNPNAITLSDGRLAITTPMLTISMPSGIEFGYNTIRLTLSNEDRTQFSDYFIGLAPFWIGVKDAAIVEMPGGKIGIFMTGGRYAVVDVTTNVGAILSSGNLNLPYFSLSLQARGTGTGSVIRRADGKYMAVYVESDDPPTNIALRYVLTEDFVTWGSPVTIPTPYLDAGNAKYNPFLFQAEDGTLNVLFEYVELWTGAIGTTEKVNIYHYASDDNGATWGPASGTGTYGAITNYADSTITPRHPYAIPLGAGNWRISYHESMSALHMSTDALGWEGTSSVYPSGVHFDEVARKAYVVNFNNLNFSSIVVVDPDTWQPIKSIHAGSTPTLNPMWFNSNAFNGVSMTVGERELTVIRTSTNQIAVYNSDTDQVTEYFFQDHATYGITANTAPKARGSTGGIGGHESDMNIHAMFLDYANRNLYLLWYNDYIWGGCYGVSKIDLTQTGPEYTNDVLWVKSSPGILLTQAQMLKTSDFKVYPDDNLMILSGGSADSEGLGGPWIGYTHLYTMGGDLIAQLDSNTSDTYPHLGLYKVIRIGGYLYGYFSYEPDYGYSGQRGLCRIDIGDLSCSYFRPTFATVDNYGFNNLMPIKDGDEILLTGSYGAVRFVLEDASWILYDNDVLPGLFPYSTSAESLAYDTVNQGIFLGSINNAMIMYFNEDGYFNQPQYMGAVFDGLAWTYGAHSPLLVPRSDRDLVMTPDPVNSGSMYAFWIHVAEGTWRVRWDKDLAEFDLTDYLVSGSSVSIKRSIDGSPAKLSLSVTHGHLFDPHNVDSLLSPVLKKFRRLRVRFGENISGVEYWHEAGTFVVINAKISHERGTYPTMQVEAEDIRTWWEDAEIVTTDHYEMTPENILKDILSTWGGMELADVLPPAMEGSYVVWFQWLDTTVKKVVDALCNRFGYFPTITVDNKFTCRKISNANAVDHTYANGTQIIGFTPDDDFSDFTNRVTVIGETRDFIDVLYEEESVGQLYGTSGWWGNKQTFEVWYSEDHKRKAKNPRLVILESCIPNSFIQKLGGGSEGISGVDPDEFFCIVVVETPDMSTTAWILGALTLATGIAACIAGIWYPSAGFGILIGWMIVLSMLLYILSGIVNWQYEIWARPWGQQRLGCSGVANDIDLQAQLGRVIEKKIDEPLCITVPQCQWLADHELMIAMAQRNRGKFEKIAHLQDEEGDTIVIPHPYSGKNMTVFITDLTRSFHVPSGKPDDKGGFIDSIDGWKVAPV